MKETKTNYNLVANTKLGGSYYVTLFKIRDNRYEFLLTKTPNKFDLDFYYCLDMKMLFEKLLDNGFYLLKENKYYFTDHELIKEELGITECKIQKAITLSTTTFEYID